MSNTENMRNIINLLNEDVSENTEILNESPAGLVKEDGSKVTITDLWQGVVQIASAQPDNVRSLMNQAADLLHKATTITNTNGN